MLLLLTAAIGCSSVPEASREVQPGQTREEVTAILGNPDEILEFTLPSEPFFGPQEGLTSLLPPGAQVEEWQYLIDEEVVYVWFAGDEAEPRVQWKVIETAIYPQDAVY